MQSEEKMIDLSKMRMITMLQLYDDVAENLVKYNPLENTHKVLIPVTPLMLDIVTERNYDGEETILEGLANFRHISIVVEIFREKFQDKLVYAIGIVGSFSEREMSKHTLNELMNIEEEKFRNFQGRSCQRFQNRHYCQKYFEDKLENLKRLVMIIFVIVS